MKFINEDIKLLLNEKYQSDNPEKSFEKFLKLKLGFYFYKKFKNNYIFPSKIKKLYRQNIVRNIILLDFKKELEKELKKTDIKYLFYKGISLLEIFPDLMNYKSLGDIDLLIDENDLKKFYYLIQKFKLTYIDKEYYFKKYKFYETSIIIKYKNYIIDLDLHIGFVQKSKFNIDYNQILCNKRVENQIIALIIQFSNAIFTEEEKAIDIYYIIKNTEVDWDYIIQKINQFRIKKISYILFKVLEDELGIQNLPTKRIELKKYEKIILNNIFKTNIFRVDQNLLYFYVFDSYLDYIKFLKDKLVKIKNNGIKEIIQSIRG